MFRNRTSAEGSHKERTMKLVIQLRRAIAACLPGYPVSSQTVQMAADNVLATLVRLGALPEDAAQGEWLKE